jgi:hypothetical protein
VSQLCLGVVAQPLRRAENASVLSLVLVWPLCGSGGDGGSRVPRAFGREVPVSIQRSVSGSGKESGRGTAQAQDNAFELFATRSRYAIHCLTKRKCELHVIEIMMDEFNWDDSVPLIFSAFSGTLH